MSNLIHKIKKYVRHPLLIPLRLMPKRLKRLIPDKTFLKYLYRQKQGKKLNLKNPILFSEKTQWLKLYDRQPVYTNMADKYEVRKYVTKTIGEEYLIPLWGGVWDKFDDIPFGALPDQFVLKCTHDSGGIIICKNKQELDIEKIRAFFKKRLLRNWYWDSRQWVYKNIKPRIIAEKLMVDESGIELKDYKLFCFNGEPKLIQVDIGRFADHKRNYYSPEWEYIPLMNNDRTAPQFSIQKPQVLESMLDLARKLSAGMPHLRVDLYVVENRIYFGELTFYSYSGYNDFDPEWDRILGDWLHLPKPMN